MYDSSTRMNLRMIDSSLIGSFHEAHHAGYSKSNFSNTNAVVRI